MTHPARIDPFRQLANYNPFHLTDPLRSMLDKLDAVWAEQDWPAFGQQLIRADVTENDNAFVLRADLPGLKKEEIAVEIDGKHVTIRAEKKEEKQEKKAQNGATVTRSECFQGTATRSFVLSRDVDAEQARASYQDGVLELTLPKKNDGQVKKLSIE